MDEYLHDDPYRVISSIQELYRDGKMHQVDFFNYSAEADEYCRRNRERYCQVTTITGIYRTKEIKAVWR